MRGPARRAAVFYNPAMAPDRDLHVAVARAVGRLGRGWEMLAATGARGLRVAAEGRALDSLYLTDRGAAAVACVGKNAARSTNVPVAVVRHDARSPLALAAFDYVDLDPYGSPAPFVAAALDALRPPGILAVSATDMRVLAGVERGVAEHRYGGVPVRGRLGPEAGLRLMLAFLARAIDARGWTIRPLLAYVRDHHVRVYLRVAATGPSTSPSIGPIDPATWDGPRLPAGGPYGPMWLGPLFDGGLVTGLSVPSTSHDAPRLSRLLDRFRAEVAADRPFFYESNVLAHEEHLARPLAPDVVIERLRAHGWAAGRSHVREGAFRTSAPRAELVRLLAESAM